MNVGLVVHHYDAADGTGGYVVRLAPHLARRHDLTIYAAAFRTPVPEGVRAVRVPALRGRAYATVLSFPTAFEFVRRRHDLVHAQGWVARRADVVTAHIVLRAWRDAARRAGVRAPPGERFFGGVVERREARLYGTACRRVIAPSTKVRAELSRCYGRTDAVEVVPHGFPAPRAPAAANGGRARFGLDEAPCVALYVGDARKGLACALRAVARVPGVELLVIGRSRPEPYRRLARQLGIGARVHWGGPLTNMAPAYGAADVLLHPTVYDAFGLVVAEAMTAGVPPIVPPTAGVTDLIRHGESGWITPSNGPEDTAAALATLAHDPALRNRLASAARRTAAGRSWETVAHETLAVYERAAVR